MKGIAWLVVLGSLIARPDPPRSLAGCPVESKYVPRPATTASAPALPTPNLSLKPIKSGDDYTVWGAAHSLRSRRHRAEVTKVAVTISGYITKTNLPDAPKCAVHRAGQADPENCRAAIPTFWLGDHPAAREGECIKVMGFAANYAQLYEAILLMDRAKPDERYRYIDTFWGVEIPNPLPAPGAKVTVKGNYGTSFSKASGIATDTVMGILTFEHLQTLQPALELATLPGLTRKKR